MILLSSSEVPLPLPRVLSWCLENKNKNCDLNGKRKQTVAISSTSWEKSTNDSFPGHLERQQASSPVFAVAAVVFITAMLTSQWRMGPPYAWCCINHFFSLGKEGEKKRGKKKETTKEDEYVIQGFTAQIALGVLYSLPFPLFLSQTAFPAGLALHPMPSLSLLSGCPIWFTFHFTLSPPLSTQMLFLLSLTPFPVWPDLPVAFSILWYGVAFHHLAGGIKRCKIFSVR